ncbi:MAG: glucosyltransferase domain-containing protein [Oscillibacter sp.]|nr:glucosyltransferase domain-containing protein [Oscillibacter sp.]
MPERNRQEPPPRIPDGRRAAPEEAMRRRAAALASTAFFSAAAHGFLFANEFFSHDSVSYFAYADWGFDFYTRIGRFFIPLYEACKGGVAAPWLIGILFVFWMSLAGIVVTELLEIRSPRGAALTCGLLCTNVSLTLTGATYVYCMDEYALALLCAAVAAYLALRGGRLALLGLPPLLVSLSIYQPYATVTAALCLLALVKQAAEGRRVPGILSRGAAALALLAAAFLAYNALWALLRILLDAPQIRDVASLESFGIKARILSANASFFAFLFRPGVALGPLRPAAHGVLLVLLLRRLLLTLANGRLSAANRILSLVLWALLPLTLYSVAVLMPGEAHDLTAYARELFYFLPLSLLDGLPLRTPRRAADAERAVVCALLALLLWHHVVYANQVYMKKELEKNSTLLLAARIVDRIEGVPGYVPGETRVAFAGRFDYNEPLDVTRGAFEDYRTQTGLWHSHAATYNLGRYLTDYLQYPLVWDTETNVTRSELAKAMPIFPAAGSVRMIDGVVVVKLSD